MRKPTVGLRPGLFRAIAFGCAHHGVRDILCHHVRQGIVGSAHGTPQVGLLPGQITCSPVGFDHFLQFNRPIDQTMLHLNPDNLVSVMMASG